LQGGDCDIGRWWCDGAHKDFCAQDPSPCGAHKAQDCTHEPDVPPAPKTNFDMFGPSNNYPCGFISSCASVSVCALTVPTCRLRGRKCEPWDGGTRSVAFVSGGFIPEAMRGKSSDVSAAARAVCEVVEIKISSDLRFFKGMLLRAGPHARRRLVNARQAPHVFPAQLRYVSLSLCTGTRR